MVAFAGLDPSVYQSGKFTVSINKISKRGSTYLRKALYQATVSWYCKTQLWASKSYSISILFQET
ncbi:MAG: transposase [Bacillota bacterium]